MSARKQAEFAEPPAKIDPQVRLNITPPMEVTHGVSIEALKQDDLQQVNNLLNILYLSLGAARDIDTICKVSGTMVKILEQRRKLLCLEYGNRSPKGKGGGTYTVPD